MEAKRVSIERTFKKQQALQKYRKNLGNRDRKL